MSNIVPISPRSQFLADEETALAFDNLVKSKPFLKGVTYANAAFMQFEGITPEQILGAQKWQKLLLGLGDRETPSFSLPSKTLKSEKPTKEPKEKK